MPSKVIAEQDSIILKKDTNYKVFKVISNRNVTFCKEKFHLDNLVGHSYGGSYNIIKGQLVKISPENLLSLTEKSKKDNEDDVIGNSGDEDNNEDVVKDNRNLIDKRENQKMTKEEINQLRKEGVTGNEIVEQLIENSSTFSNKTEFSKEKYIKKKAKKHINVFTLLEANTRNLLNMYYFKGPTKICNLRMDSLAQVLTYANVRAGGRYLVVDNCLGLVLGSMIERMNGQGLIMNMYTGSAPSQPAIELGYNFSDEQKSILHEYPLNRIAALDAMDQSEVTKNDDSSIPMEADVPVDSGDESDEADDDECGGDDDNDANENSKGKNSDDKKRKRSKDIEERNRRRDAKRSRTSESTDLMRLRNMDGLIVCSKFFPTPIVVSLMKFLLPSRPIVVFCPYSEPLLDCYSHLKERGDVLMLKLSENWLRSYQILPERSHPHVNMSGSGGFILTGLNVRND